jgi:putative transposase
MVVFRRFDPERHHRKSIRLQNRDYSMPGIYFVTLCIIDKNKVLSQIRRRRINLTPAGTIVKAFWDQIPGRYPSVILREYVIMPDHFHGILIVEPSGHGTTDSSVNKARNAEPGLPTMGIRRKMTLPKIIGWFKMNTAKEINLMFKSSGNPFWQRDYYERVIRNRNELKKIEWYIRTNPSRWK